MQCGQTEKELLSCSHVWTSEPGAGEQLHQVCTSPQGSPSIQFSCAQVSHDTPPSEPLCTKAKKLKKS